MSPYLFFFFAAPMLESLKKSEVLEQGDKLTIFNYIDDTYLLVTSEEYSINIERMRKAFRAINEWATESHMTFEPSKFEIMHFEKP